VLILNDQCCIKKNDTILIHSHKKIRLNKSKVQKKINANWEKIDDKLIIDIDPESYSKYSLKKLKHNKSAVIKIPLKKQEISSKIRIMLDVVSVFVINDEFINKVEVIFEEVINDDDIIIKINSKINPVKQITFNDLTSTQRINNNMLLISNKPCGIKIDNI